MTIAEMLDSIGSDVDRIRKEDLDGDLVLAPSILAELREVHHVLHNLVDMIEDGVI